MNSFILKNKYIIGLASWLNELSLQGADSRERTRFVNVLIERINENEKFRTGLLDQYCEKEEDGKTKKKKVLENGEEVWDVSDENMILYQKEFTDLMDEDYTMDILDGNKQKLKVMKNAVLNTNYIFGPQEVDTVSEKQAKLRQMHDYDEWCKAFEGVDFAE